MIGADDLELLTRSFTAAMERGHDASTLDASLHELGWVNLLGVSPYQAAAMAFELLGRNGSVATLLDDVVLDALGMQPTADLCVLLPEPHHAEPPGCIDAGVLTVRGLVSTRVDTATRVLVPSVAEGVFGLVEVECGGLGPATGGGLDPQVPYRRVGPVSVPVGATVPVRADSWPHAVRHARGALAHELLGVSRRMLEFARSHAVGRVQFGRPIASFQAVRTRLAESLVAIEGAAAVAAVLGESSDPLVAAMAKSLAGKAARTTAAHAQQVLAGIGFTTDHPFHLAMKRALVVDTVFGSAKTLPAEIGRELLARRSAPRLMEL